MGNLWLKIKMWTKVVLFAALLIYSLIFILKNEDRQAKLWIWFGHEPERSVLWYTSFAFLAGVVVTVLIRTIWKTMRQVREVQRRNRQERLEREVADMKAKAAKLQTRPVVADPDVP